MQPNELLIKKTIYPSRKGMTNKMLNDVMRLEIEHHLNKHPHLAFKEVSKPIKNDDRTTTFLIRFMVK